MDKKTCAKLIAFGVLLYAAVNRLDAVSFAFLKAVQVLKPVLLGFATAFLLNIPLRLIESLDKKRVIPRGVGILLAVALVLAAVAAAGLILLPQLVDSGMALLAKLPEWLNAAKDKAIELYDSPQLREWIEGLSIDWQSIIDSVLGFLRNGAFAAITSAAEIASGAVGDVTSLILSFIIALGMLSVKERMGLQASRVVRAFVKPSLADRIINAFGLMHRAYMGFFTAQLTEAVIIGSLVMLLMLIIGFPRPFMVATLVALGALVPLFGAFVAALVSSLLLMAEFSVATGLWFLACFVVLQQIEGNVIYPRVMGKRIGLPSILVLVAVVIGGNAMGIIGMIVFVPLVSVAYSLVSEEVSKRE